MVMREQLKNLVTPVGVLVLAVALLVGVGIGLVLAREMHHPTRGRATLHLHSVLEE